MADCYNYTKISEKDKQFAIADLNENPLQVNAHIESFRRWVKSMPHLTCPTVAKFDHKKAEQRLDNFCTVRSSPRGAPEYFTNIKMDDPIVNLVLDSMIILPLGRTNVGELILLIRAGKWNSDTMPLTYYTNMITKTIELIMTEEESQIYGVKMLVDLADVPKKSVMAWSDSKFIKNMSMILNDSNPIRMKGQIFYNEPVIFDIILVMYAFFLSDKMKGRIFRVQNDIQKAMEKIPGLEAILPTEYGGKSGPMSECSKKWANRFKTYYKNGNPLIGISVDESKRPQETLSYLAKYAEYTGPKLGMEGTFTKYDNVF